ncbi:YD repeat-containing protein, partial [Pseudomonas cannabina]|uniref:YD repeat-containing protein n=1 Tax=Pseudomonas cannabina TaxID=86840 RepID=A0A0P9NTG2_PSECA
MGITMTSQAAAYVATGVLAAGTVLGAASTASTAYGAVKGDDTALRVGEYLGRR